MQPEFQKLSNYLKQLNEFAGYVYQNAKNQHHISVQYWDTVDSIFGITFGMPGCTWPFPYEWMNQIDVPMYKLQNSANFWDTAD